MDSALYDHYYKPSPRGDRKPYMWWNVAQKCEFRWGAYTQIGGWWDLNGLKVGEDVVALWGEEWIEVAYLARLEAKIDLIICRLNY